MGLYGTLFNECLQSFASAWNDQKLRTTNMTPNQMLINWRLTSNDLHVTEAFTDSRSIMDRIDDQMQTALMCLLTVTFRSWTHQVLDRFKLKCNVHNPHTY